MSFVSKWINKLRYIQTMEFYLVTKRNKLSSLEKIWRNFKYILLSEITQTEKNVLSNFNYITFWKGKNYVHTQKNQWLAGVGEK